MIKSPPTKPEAKATSFQVTVTNRHKSTGSHLYCLHNGHSLRALLMSLCCTFCFKSTSSEVSKQSTSLSQTHTQWEKPMEGKGWVSRHQLYQRGEMKDNSFFCLNATSLLIPHSWELVKRNQMHKRNAYFICLLTFSKIACLICVYMWLGFLSQRS